MLLPYGQRAKGGAFVYFGQRVEDIKKWSRTVYHIYPKYSDTSTPYHTCSKIWTSSIYYLMLYLKIAGWVANSVDPDETPLSAASHLGLHCLLRPVCPNTYGKYGTLIISNSEGVKCSMCWPWWLCHMRVQLVIRRLRVRPPPGWQQSFVEIDHEIFSTVILSLQLTQEGQLSVSCKRMSTILVNCLED